MPRSVQQGTNTLTSSAERRGRASVGVYIYIYTQITAYMIYDISIYIHMCIICKVVLPWYGMDYDKGDLRNICHHFMGSDRFLLLGAR